MGRAIWLLGVATLVLLPLIWCLTYGAEFIGLANESLAYRFFYIVRLHSGSDLTAWLPQGQLVTSIQHLIVWLLPDLTAENLRSSVNSFSLWTLASVSAVSVAGLALGSASTNWLDRLTLSVVALVPLYVFPTALIWLWPDYLALNIALVVLTIALFQREWGRDRGSWIRCAVYGVLAGSIAANKISMVVIVAPLVVLATTHHATVKTTIARTGIAGISAVLALAVWLGAAGLFQVEWLRAVLPKWLAVINMGPEAGFTAWPYLWSSYALTVLWFAAALLVAATGMRERRTYAVGAMTLVSALLCIVAIWKRPAGTTVSDTALVLLGLGAMLFTFSKRSLARDAAIAAGAFAFIGAAILSRQPSIMHVIIAGSRPSGEEQCRDDPLHYTSAKIEYLKSLKHTPAVPAAYDPLTWDAIELVRKCQPPQKDVVLFIQMPREVPVYLLTNHKDAFGLSSFGDNISPKFVAERRKAVGSVVGPGAHVFIQKSFAAYFWLRRVPGHWHESYTWLQKDAYKIIHDRYYLCILEESPNGMLATVARPKSDGPCSDVYDPSTAR